MSFKGRGAYIKFRDCLTRVVTGCPVGQGCMNYRSMFVFVYTYVYICIYVMYIV